MNRAQSRARGLVAALLIVAALAGVRVFDEADRSGVMRADAIVLAAAGLKRLGLEARIRTTFEPNAMLPAAGQGALGIEVRSDRHDLIDALAPLAHLTTWLTVAAERAVSRAMGGSCSMPLAAHGIFTQGVLQLDAAWGDPEDKAPLVRAQASAPVTTLAQAEALGDAIAQRLRAGGARGVTPA